MPEEILNQKQKADLFRKYIICEAYKVFDYIAWRQCDILRYILDESSNMGFLKHPDMSHNTSQYNSMKMSRYLGDLIQYEWVTCFKNRYKILLSVDQIKKFQKEVILHKLAL